MSTAQDAADPTTLGETLTAESERREISGGAHFAALDGYRAIAALMVVLTHVAFVTGAVLTFRWGYVLQRFDFGVTLFFLLSGFLLYRPWVKASLTGAPRPSLRRYTVRRAARILPAYWLVVIATLLLVPQLITVDLGTWVRYLTATHVYFPETLADGLYHTWSLCTEIAFYVALPVLGMLAVGRRVRSADSAVRRHWAVLGALVVLATAFTVVRLTTGLLPAQAGFWLPGYLDWFAGGMALAVLEVRATLPEPPRVVRVARALAQDAGVCLVLAVSFFAIACTPLGGPYDLSASQPWEALSKHWLYLLTAMCLLLPATVGRGRGWSGQLARPGIHHVGLVSYGIFLWHMMLIFLLMPRLGIAWFSGQMPLVLSAVLACTLVVATLSYVLVERPAQRWAHRR